MSPKVFAAIYYITNYITKSQTDCGQLILAATILKKAQEVAKSKTTVDVRLLVPKPFNMAKFALKAYYRFIKNTKVKTPIVAHFLFNQLSFYMPLKGRSITINFY